jgi:rhodanese-related sulfurtransferase
MSQKYCMMTAGRAWAAALLLVALSSGVFAQSITPRDLGQKMVSGNQLVIFDIRDQTSFARTSLPGAINIVWNGVSLPYGYWDHIGTYAREIIVVCQDGTRSEAVTLFLKKQGYTNVSYLEGGLTAWGNGAYNQQLTTWGVIKVLFGNSHYRHKQG